MTTRIHRPLIERFFEKVDITATCWLWRGAKATNGYGHIMVTPDGDKPLAAAHRISYELLVGPIPYGLQLDHLCCVKSCVNPDHLEPVSQSVNRLRANAMNPQTHCAQGHEFTPENTYRYPDGRRRCRMCRLAYFRVWKAAQTADNATSEVP